MKGITTTLCSIMIPALLLGCSSSRLSAGAGSQRTGGVRQLSANATPRQKIVASALEQTTYTFGYDPSYVKLSYPNGDVPSERGVCSDVVIRSFRKAGLDLQKEVHEDMKKSFREYPKNWGLARPDSNIDHRRVANLMTYFSRTGKAVALSNHAGDYLPADIVAWDLGGGLLHVGVVTDERSENGDRFLVVHNIGSGAQLQDVLFSWRIIGHYRCFAE